MRIENNSITAGTTCSRCGEWKSAEMFYKNRRHKTGLQSACKPCMHANNLRWQRENPERHRARNRAWQIANPDKVRNNIHKRRAKIQSPGVTPKDWQRLVRRFGSRCAYCGTHTSDLQQDHVVPISRGGRHSIGNLLPACGPCNNSKHARFLVEWRKVGYRLGP